MKLNKKQVTTIKNYLQAIEGVFESGQGGGHWPGDGAQIQSAFSNIAALDFYNLYNNLSEKYSPDKIAQKVPAFSIFFPLRQAGIIGLKVAHKHQSQKIKQSDILNFFFKLTRLMRIKTFSDPFCLDQKYHLWSKDKLKNICREINWHRPEKNDTQRIALLSATLEAYSWAFYYDLYRSTGFEIHGPYDVSPYFGSNTVLLVKNGHNLAPREIWPQKFPYQSIVLYLIYKNADINLDFLNRQYSPKPVKENLIHYSLFVNGEEKSSGKIDKIDKELEKKLKQQTNRVNNLSPLKIIKKGAEIYYYSLKPFFQLLNKDWYPKPQVFQEIDSYGLKFWKNRVEDKVQEKGKFYRQLFDPRNNFYGQ